MINQRYSSLRYFIGVFFCLITLSLGGCSRNKPVDTQPTDITPIPKQTIDLSKDIREVGEIVVDENAIRLKDGFADSSLKLMNTSDEAFQINEINSKSSNFADQNNVLIAKDHSNDILYYINSGEDFFIYRLKDGISQLLVDIPAANLYLQNGLMYFMVRSYDMYNFYDIREGNILSYDPISGKVDIIIQEQADGMIVRSDGIDWYQKEQIVQPDGEYTIHNYRYTYSFETGTSKQWNTSSKYMIRSDEYYLDSTESVDETTGVSSRDTVWRKEDGRSHIGISHREYFEKIALTKDFLYGFLDDGFSGTFGIFDMSTHEIEYMDLIPLEEEGRDIVYRSPGYFGSWSYSYSLLDNTIYFMTPHFIYFMEGGTLHAYGMFAPEDAEEYRNHNLYDLFTDGDNLIALLGPSNTVDKNKKLYIIDFETDDSKPEWIFYEIIPTKLGS